MLRMTVNTITIMMMLTIPRIVSAMELDERRDDLALPTPLVHEVARNEVVPLSVGGKIVYSREELLAHNNKPYSEKDTEEFLKSFIKALSIRTTEVEQYKKILNPNLHDQFSALFRKK